MFDPKKVAVVGGGSWGTTFANLASRKIPTQLWVRPEEASLAEAINRDHQSEPYLPGIALDPRLRATSSMKEAIADADVVVMGVPSQWFRAVYKQVQEHLRPKVPVISLAKGLETHTLLRVNEIIAQETPAQPRGVFTGPNLAKEIAKGIASASVLALTHQGMVMPLRRLFTTKRLRVYTNRDIVGCELGGALKNVIAIACGMSDGLGGGDNTRAAFITRGLAELTRLGMAMGGEPQTFAGLAGVGDLIATCTSTQSRNHTVGVELAKGRTIKDIVDNMSAVAEGVKTSRVVVELGESYGVPVPIAREVFEVCHEDKKAVAAWRTIIGHEAGGEDEPD